MLFILFRYVYLKSRFGGASDGAQTVQMEVQKGPIHGGREEISDGRDWGGGEGPRSGR